MTDGTDVQAAPESAPAESDNTAATTTEQPAAETTTEADGDETKADDEAGDDGDDEDKPRRASRSERHKRALAAARAEAADLKARLAEVERARNTPAKDDRPKEADFNGDYAGFERALNAYEIEQVFNKVEARKNQEQAAHREAVALQEKFDALKDAEDEIRERIPDYDKVTAAAAKDGVQFSKQLGELVLNSSKSAHLTYFLAGKPEKVRELNALPPLDAARELGQIEARLSLPTPNKSTKAPSPRSAPAGGAAAAPDLGTMSMEDYVAYRQKQRG